MNSGGALIVSTVALPGEDGELAGGLVAAHQDRVHVEGVAGDPQLEVVLVGPLPGALDRTGTAGIGAGGLLGLLQGLGYARHAEYPVADRHRSVGHVADREAAGSVTERASQVDHDATCGREARLVGDLVFGRRAQADYHRVAGNYPTVGQAQTDDLPRPRRWLV